MNTDLHTAVSFSGHRTYRGEAEAALRSTLEALYEQGFRTFSSGMAVGFDLAAAEAVLELRSRHADVRLVAVVPFCGQERRFGAADRERFCRIVYRADECVVLADAYHRGCYAVRNDCLVARARVLVAWYDGSPGGTHYTVCRARRLGLRIIHLHPSAPLSEPSLFE